MRPTTRRLLAVAGSLALVAGITLAPSSSAATAPGYTIWHAPEDLPGYDDAAEPTLGSNWTTGNTMYQAGLSTFRVSFDSDGVAKWTDQSSLLTSLTTLDPILYTDPATDRTFVSQLTGACSLLSYTDDDGDSWVQNPVGCGAGTAGDHQSVGGGPFAATAGGGVGYKDAVYYCAQQIAAATCASSRDGGLTFGPGVPIYTIAQCGGLHGHIMVAPDGTAYVPNADCGGKHGVAVSTNNGATWAVRTVPDSATQFESDPAVGIGADGTMYLGFQQASTTKGVNETYPGIAVSTDRGATFQNVNPNIGSALGIKNIQFPRVVAGDGDRAAYAFLGTTTEGDDQAAGFDGTWHLYIATTYNRGVTWTTVKATPDSDPVQKGCIWLAGGSNACRNLLDFMGSTVDKQGRVLIGYADGCNATCAAAGGKNDRGATAVIARQSSGLGLFKAFDGDGTTTTPATTSPAPSPASEASPPASTTTAPGAPTGLTAAAAKGRGIQLSWTAPSSDGGSAITGYRVYRDEALLTTVSGTSHKDTSVTAGRTYGYTVRAVNAVGESAQSNAASATAK